MIAPNAAILTLKHHHAPMAEASLIVLPLRLVTPSSLTPLSNLCTFAPPPAIANSLLSPLVPASPFP